jgi:hypothetical protein
MSRDTLPVTQPSSVALLGSDAVLAALPATPVQLAHACRALGFELAIPASWGDELVAEGCIAQLADRGSEPAIVCACPYVTERLTRVGPELAPWMLTLVAPPVAAARYIRAVYGERPVHITYVGTCPAGSNPAFDARCSPDELLAMLAERGIELTAQPELFDSVLPPDRRRFHSLPGGTPSPERLADVAPEYTLVQLEGSDALLALAQRLLTRRPELIDLAPQSGCACSGALVNGTPAGARAALVALEPPRAHTPVLDPAVPVEVQFPAPPAAFLVALAPRPAGDDAADTAGIEPPSSAPVPEAGLGGGLDRRPAVHRAANSAPMIRRADGRSIPRAYAAWKKRPTPPAAPDEPVSLTADPSLAGEPTPPTRVHPPTGTRRPAITPSIPSRIPPSEPRPPLPPPPTGPRRSARFRFGTVDA